MAAPETVKIGGTYYLKDAESYLDKAPVMPKLSICWLAPVTAPMALVRLP